MHHDEPLSEELVSALRKSADHYAFMGETRGLAGVMAALQEPLSSSSTEAERQAGELLRDLLDLASLRKSQVLLQSLTATIHRCFLAETDPTSVGKLIECAGEAISVEVKLSEYGIAETLIWELRGGDSARCSASVHLHIVLEKVCRNEALDTLIDGLHSNDVARREGAANLSKDLKQDIRTALSHPLPRVRAHAVNVLSGVPEGWAYEMLFDLAVSGDTPVACKAIRAIGEKDGEETGHRLLSILPSIADENLERECYLALGKLRCIAAVNVLERVASSPKLFGIRGKKSKDVRAAASWAIGQIGGGAGV